MNGENVSVEDFLQSFSLDELRRMLAERNAEVENIQAQLRQDVLVDRRGKAWRHKARGAIRHKRIDAALLDGHIRKIERDIRAEQHFSRMSDAQLAALERTKEVIAMMIERDRLNAERETSQGRLFVKAALKMLSKEAQQEIWIVARSLDPDNSCWTDAKRKSNGEEEAVRRAKKLRALHGDSIVHAS